ncbi:nuclear transport factor 2 family protein [Paenibacillus peoriae]|uniref:nuclear transport factor 2 family protein n=1 Tax=Paenibacillus peoriae TaxID=59893 RepID=UPI00026C5C6B|nr:nuclear transport factor 2 family protein [Paenibacillus peoriae]MEC0184675.1 nuclear transport factor 2 family protein [Paenibacillus peoriae]
MPTQAEMKAVVQKYIDGLNNHDAEALASLYADNARIEDPVGSESIVEGKDAIYNMYKVAATILEKAELDAPIRASHGNSAAMAFTFYLNINGVKSKTRAIDVMTFDESCKIIDMKAYWGSEDSAEV